MHKINMAAPYFSASDRREIHVGIDSILDDSLSMGPNVRSFEQEFAAMVGVKYAIAMHSCTAALEVSLAALGVNGGEVIVPGNSFIATAMAVHLSGGIPVFAEISESTFCLDLEDVKFRTNPRTKGVILVHMAGLITPDILELREFCDANNLFFIEDAAHAPGSKFEEHMAGSFGHAGCFSFFPTKVITAGEGGMLTTNDDKVAEVAYSLQSRGKDINAKVEQYNLPGRNIRMTEMAALLGRVQLSHLESYLGKRRHIASIYRTELEADARVQIILPNLLEASSCWKVPLLLDANIDRLEVAEQMKNAGISVDFTYQPALHLQPIFRNLYRTKEGQLPRTEDILSRNMCLPCHPQMTEADGYYVVDALKRILDLFRHS